MVDPSGPPISRITPPRPAVRSRRIDGVSPQAGFTISELVLVVALVAALVLIAVTSVRGIRRETATSDCQSQLRTLKLATEQYQSEQGTYPADESVLLAADRVDAADIEGWTVAFGPGDTAPAYRAVGDCA